MKQFFRIMAICMCVSAVGFARQDGPRPGGFQRFTPQQDSARFARMNAEVEQKLGDLRKRIVGQESKPATEVFKNIKSLKDLNAGALADRMGIWSRSLGISCEHCHTVDKWETEDKGEKEAARGMDLMMGEINSKLIVNVKNLDSKVPSVTCWTCHQGRVKPSRPPWARQQRREN